MLIALFHAVIYIYAVLSKAFDYNPINIYFAVIEPVTFGCVANTKICQSS